MILLSNPLKKMRNEKGGFVVGHKHSEETKEKMREAKRKYFENGGMSAFKGKKHTNSAKQKIKEKRAIQIHPRLGRKFGPLSTSHRLAVSLSLRGKKKSQEHIEKVRLANIGKIAGEKHPNWKGGKSLYRSLFEKFLDRKLKSKEVIHHFDGNRNNSSIQNLCLMRTRASHTRLHRFAKRHRLPISMFRFNQDWLKNEYATIK